ncbi:MAG: putative toxin-antitoxin system toxin component, PIN family [Deinococcota bacterium]
MRVVLDTNVIISAFMSLQSVPRTAVNLWVQKRYQLVSSTWQLKELRKVSRYPKVRARVKQPAEIGAFINLVYKRAFLVTNLPRLDISPDPDDNFIVATALVGQADYLVSGDKLDLQQLKKVSKTKVISAAQFVKLFG